MIIKLSISLITYNHEQFIAKTLNSILSQEVNFKYEIIIGEDCSSDNTRKIVKEFQDLYPDIIKLIPREKNIGSTKNFSETLLTCKGEYIAMIDGDDLMLPNKLQKQVDFLDANNDYVMITHALRAFNNKTDETLRIVQPKLLKSCYTIEDLIVSGSIFGNSSKMFRREALPNKPVSSKINFIADLYLTIHVAGLSKIGFINETLGEYRVHEGNMMKNLKGKEVLEDIETTFNSIKSRFGEKYNSLFKNKYCYGHLIVGMDLLHQGKSNEARNSLMKSIRIKPFYTRSQVVYYGLTFLPSFIRNKIINIKHTFAK
jgi:glycosyltransferase involved in cell wall biosynthesis